MSNTKKEIDQDKGGEVIKRMLKTPPKPKGDELLERMLKTPPKPLKKKPKLKRSQLISRLSLYEFLAFPAHCWLHLAAWIAGGKFECGPVNEEDDQL